MKKILNALIVLALLLCATAPVSVFALEINTSYVPLTDIPGFSGLDVKNPGGVLVTIFNLSIGIGAILAVIMIVIAGFKYMYEESIFGKGKAKEQITNAFFGLLLILGSYIILKTINGELLRVNLLLPAGDGKLGGLVAAKGKADQALATQLKLAALESTARAQAIDSIKKEVATIEESIKTTQIKLADLKKKPLTEENKLAIANLESQLKTQEQTLVSSTASLNSKIVEDVNLTSKSIISISREKLFTQEIVNVSNITEKDPSQSATEALTSLKKLASNTDTQMLAIAKKIDGAVTLNLSGDAAKQRDSSVLVAQQDVAYLSVSKNMLAEMSNSGTNFNSYSEGLQKQSAELDKIIKNYSEKAVGFESIGRDDLSTQLKNDIANATKLMQLKVAQSCSWQTTEFRSSVTICKQ